MASTIDDLSSDSGLERSKCKLDAGCGGTSSRRSAENDGLRAARQNEARWRTNDRGGVCSQSAKSQGGPQRGPGQLVVRAPKALEV